MHVQLPVFKLLYITMLLKNIQMQNSNFENVTLVYKKEFQTDRHTDFLASFFMGISVDFQFTESSTINVFLH